jgi:hypothetical protein
MVLFCMELFDTRVIDKLLHVLEGKHLAPIGEQQ